MLFAANRKNSETLKYHKFSKQKKLVFSLTCSQCGSKDEKIFKKEESIKAMKILGLISNIEQYQNKYDWRKYKSRIYM